VPFFVAIVSYLQRDAWRRRTEASVLGDRASHHASREIS
jgi:hypothetical protein